MSFDATKVDLVLQYALLLAGQEDDYFDRQLGPIHLIKYVYLADFAFARRNRGETYTGVDWVLQVRSLVPSSQRPHRTGAKSSSGRL